MRVAEDPTTALSDRIATAPPLADAKRAEARLAELIERAGSKPEPAALPPLLGEGHFRDLIVALADHSPFLWQTALTDPARKCPSPKRGGRAAGSGLLPAR